MFSEDIKERNVCVCSRVFKEVEKNKKILAEVFAGMLNVLEGNCSFLSVKRWFRFKLREIGVR